MSVLKKLKRATASKKAGVTDVTRIVANVNQMISMKLIELGTDLCELVIEPAIWEGKSDSFKSNSCKNVLNAWFVMRGKPYNDRQELVVYEKDGDIKGLRIATYSIKGGFKEVSVRKR